MPIQTQQTGYIAFPDGGRVSVQEAGVGPWYDVGAINSPVNFTLNYTENDIVTANAGRLQKQVRDMLIDGSFTLINLDPEAIGILGGGMFEVVEEAEGTRIYAGQSTHVFVAYGLRIEHYNDDDVIDRSFEIYSTEPTSGGFQFNFKGANEDGVEEMPLSFQGKINPDKADGRQLFEYYVMRPAT